MNSTTMENIAETQADQVYVTPSQNNESSPQTVVQRHEPTSDSTEKDEFRSRSTSAADEDFVSKSKYYNLLLVEVEKNFPEF